MNWRKFIWLIIVLLIAAVIWKAADLKDAYEKIASTKSGDSDDAEQRLESLQKKLADQKRRAENLEKFALWQTGEDFMSWLTQQADDSSVRIIGVERSPVEKVQEYRHVPVNITAAGDYSALGRFVNQLERSSSKIRINSFRMRRKKETSAQVTMDISLSYFQKAEGSP